MNRVQKELRALADKTYAKECLRFFKTGKGEYGEGDVFLGIRVPDQRKIAKKYFSLPLKEVKELIKSKYHEERLTGLIILLHKYDKADEKSKELLFKEYIRHFNYVNNWDLVDVSCHKIVGAHLLKRDRKILYKWAKSNDLWTKRISIISTLWFIKFGEVKDTLAISDILLEDEHDLIHKAVGWMIREAAKKEMKTVQAYLKTRYQKMPRTMLRYAIEKFPEKTRKAYLKGTI